MSTKTDLIALTDQYLYHTDLFYLECTCLIPPTSCKQTLALISLEDQAPFTHSFCIPNMFPFLSTLYYLGASIGYLLDVNATSVSTTLLLSLPVACCSIAETLYRSLLTQYPLAKLSYTSSISLLATPIEAITSLTFSPSSKQSNNFILSTLLETTKGDCYSILFLSHPVDACTYLKSKKQLLSLYEKLIPLREQTHSFTDTTSTTHSASCTNGTSKSDTRSTSDTENTSNSSTLTEVSSSNLNVSPKLTNKATFNQSRSNSCTENRNQVSSDSNTNTCNNQVTSSSSSTDSDSCTTTNSHTYSKREFNREIDRHVIGLDALVAIFEKNTALPVFQFGVYFMGTSIATTLTAASTYNALLQPSAPLVNNFYFNNWFDDPSCLNRITHYLETLQHPLFCLPSTHTPTAPALIINNYELNHLVFACTNTPSSSASTNS